MGLFVLTWLFAFWLSLNPAVASLVETKHINWWPRSYSVNCDEGIHCQLSLENEGVDVGAVSHESYLSLHH